jgi:hypothetical protein
MLLLIVHRERRSLSRLLANRIFNQAKELTKERLDVLKAEFDSTSEEMREAIMQKVEVGVGKTRIRVRRAHHISTD